MRKCYMCGHETEVGYVAQNELYCDWCIVSKIEEMENEINNLLSQKNKDEIKQEDDILH